MSVFSAAEAVWIERLGDLRNVVRQELIAGQLANHVRPGARVLDVGCGQGTQAIRLAARGCAVLGVDPSRQLLDSLDAQARRAGVRVQTQLGSLDDLPALLGECSFDLVCAHGLLMYLDDVVAALAALATRVGPAGAVSLTFRNGAALAFRPGMRGHWEAAVAALDTRTYVNELGLQAKAHTLDDIVGPLARLGLAVEQWYGVRVFTDPAPADEPPPSAPELELLLAAEYEAGRRDPYRQLGSQLHLVARRSP